MIIEVVLTSVTDAVIGFVVDHLGQGLTDKARTWLGRDPQRVAFKLAFARAYSAFVEQYPTSVDALFDENFLKGRAVPVLALCLTRAGKPQATDLAAAWADQLGLKGDTRRQQIDQLTPAATFFLQRLEQELRAREEFQPLFDSRALDAIAENSGRTSQELEKLRDEISKVLKEANQKYQISIGAGAQGTVIGDHNTVTNTYQKTVINNYQVDKEELAHLISDSRAKERVREQSLVFETLVNERTRDFVGRRFIFEAIDTLLKKPEFPSGYIVIRGEPGIGKTALMAKLVKDRGYVHHFNIALQNIRSTGDFLTDVCAQLIVHYGLPHEAVPSKAAQDSGLLLQLLGEAAAQPQSLPLVVLVDALDEAEDTSLPPNANRLYLPQALPPGVFFIATSREEQDYHLSVDRREDIYLDDKGPQNLEDVKEYIRAFLSTHHDQMAERIAQWGVDEEEFVKEITEKSEGNFMYLVYVLGDINGGKLTAANVDAIRNLPRGLQDYYQRHLRTMRAQDTERFEHYYQPVVCMLAVAREPVTRVQVAEWTSLSPLRVSEVIGAWREFLNEDVSVKGESFYRLYHASFREFLKKEVGLEQYDDAIAQTALNKIQW